MISMIPLPRMMYALSQDGMIMQCFSKVNERTQVPLISTIVAGLSIGKTPFFFGMNFSTNDGVSDKTIYLTNTQNMFSL